MAKKSKSDNQKKHAFRRCRERYGFYMTDHDWLEMVRMIQRGDAHFVDDETQRVKRYVLSYKDQDFAVLFDTARQNIVTFLPKDALQEVLEKIKDDDPGDEND